MCISEVNIGRGVWFALGLTQIVLTEAFPVIPLSVQANNLILRLTRPRPAAFRVLSN